MTAIRVGRERDQRSISEQAYIDAQLARRKASAEGEALTALETWAACALAEANRIDPLLRDAIPGPAR
jgi:hypothetical protein